MYFEHKLHTILELFDKSFNDDAMDGVAVSNSFKTVTYSFSHANTRREIGSNDSITYSVVIKAIPAISGDRTVQAIIGQITNTQLPGNILTKYVYDLSLKHNTIGHEYKLTGLGNANFVYGKMLACFFDFIDKHGVPALVNFTAANPNMNLVYVKLLKFIERTKGLKYRLIDDEGLYALDEVLKNIDIEKDEVTQHVDKMQQDFEQDMQHTRERKAFQRQQWNN
jgi:hypothetical protein